MGLWLCAQWLCGDVAELCSLINYALAANEIELAELPLWLSVIHAQQILLCPGTGSTAGPGRDGALVPGQMGALRVGGVW